MFLLAFNLPLIWYDKGTYTKLEFKLPGGEKMKGFIQEYGNIIVVVAVILLMLLFGKTGFAKNIQDAILGSANHIVDTGENVTKGLEVKSGDVLTVEGNRYIVMEQFSSSNFLVVTTNSLGIKAYQSISRLDGKNKNTYENSEIDNYLENEWYKGLSAKMQNAIQSVNIKQVSYDYSLKKYDTGYNGQLYNNINRHVFLPSINEIEKIINFKNSTKVKNFLNNTSIWTRDSYVNHINNSEFIDAVEGEISFDNVFNGYGIRPAFVIDLSKIDYTEAGHVDYK